MARIWTLVQISRPCRAGPWFRLLDRTPFQPELREARLCFMKNSQLGNWAVRNYESSRPGPCRVHSFFEPTTAGAGSRSQGGWRSGKRDAPYVSSQHHILPGAARQLDCKCPKVAVRRVCGWLQICHTSKARIGEFPRQRSGNHLQECADATETQANPGKSSLEARLLLSDC